MRQYLTEARRQKMVDIENEAVDILDFITVK